MRTRRRRWHITHRGKIVLWLNEQSEEDKAFRTELHNSGTLPRHVAIIMDGNGRWAQERNMPRVAGHQEGIDSVRDAVKACSNLGVSNLTLYAFSMENWRRPQLEIDLLMSLLQRYLRKETAELHENNVRLNAIGKINALPKSVQRQLRESMDMLANNTGLTLTLALSYSARWDIVRAVQTLTLDVRRGKLSPEDISETSFAEYLQTAGMPDPDLLIRTSGELRLSNFLLWEMAYSEIYVTDSYWPDFRKAELYDALRNYRTRERRYGRTSQQLKDTTPDRSGESESYVKRLINTFKSQSGS